MQCLAEEHLPHADRSPLEPKQAGGEADFPIAEQWLEPLHREFAERTLDDLRRAQLCRVLRIFRTAEFVQDIFREPGFHVILVGHTVDDRDGLGLAAAR